MGQVILDEFLIQRKLGEGGFGAVYLVRSGKSLANFAVKRALVPGAKVRRALLAELLAWVDFPSHPYLTACRFFRTLGDEVLIFSEFVDGGSLAESISSGRLYAGGPPAALRRILDIAIQFAWGLAAIHQCGLIHQDVKPGNLLLAATGQAKVADFGLAAARSRTAERQTGQTGTSLIFSAAGGTPAYMSPEQWLALRRKGNSTPGQASIRLTRQSDIYGWGVSVLEMFLGERRWKAGHTAGSALDACLTATPDNPNLPAMPAEVVEVLRRALQDDPAARWDNLTDAAAELVHAYQRVAGEPYPRSVPPALTPAATIIADRLATTYVSWQDPREWLAIVCQLTGCQPPEARKVGSAPGAGLQAQAIADLLVFEQVSELLQRAVLAGRTDLAGELRQLRADKALAHEYARDLPGALALWDENIAELERQSAVAPSLENAVELAENCVNKGNTLTAGGQFQAAIEHYERASRAVEAIFNSTRNAAIGRLLSTAFNDQGHALACLGRHQAALPVYDRAIKLRESLYRADETADRAEDIAHSCMNKANSLAELKRHREAIALYDRAEELHEQAIHRDGRSEFRSELAKTWANRAGVLTALGEAQSAVESSRRAMALWETLVEQEGRREWTADLALACMNAGAALHKLDDNRAAERVTERGLDLFDRLFRQDGRHDLAFRVAQSHANLGEIHQSLESPAQALAHYEQALEIFGDAAIQGAPGSLNRGLLARGMVRASVRKLQLLAGARRTGQALAYFEGVAPAIKKLIQEENLFDMLADLAMAQVNAAGLLSVAGRGEEAVRLCNEAVACYERALATTGGEELRPDLLRCRVLRALLLSDAGEFAAARAEAKATLALMRQQATRQPGEQSERDLAWAMQTLRQLQ